MLSFKIRPFLSCCLPLVQNESWCSTIQMIMICMKNASHLCTRTRFETEANSNSERSHNKNCTMAVRKYRNYCTLNKKCFLLFNWSSMLSSFHCPSTYNGAQFHEDGEFFDHEIVRRRRVAAPKSFCDQVSTFLLFTICSI